jgi:lipid-A-disaccharide synthase
VKKILIIAGEASGDLHAAELVSAVKKKLPDVYFYGLGGIKMAQQGVKLLWDLHETAVIGLFDVIRNFKKIYQILRTLKKILRKEPPDLLVLVDYPGLNLHLTKVAKKYGVKVFYYISPQLWATREYRVKIIKNCVDKIAVIFPFEVDYYRKFGINAYFVGNPLTDVVKTTMTPAETKAKFALKNDAITIGLCPGSRKGEVKKILPTLVKVAELLTCSQTSGNLDPHVHEDDTSSLCHHEDDTASLCHSRGSGNLQFVLPIASSLYESDVADYLKSSKVPIKITKTDNYDVMKACDLIIAASGTVTLEIALLGVPLIIVYRIFPLWFPLAKFIKTNIGLCNIMAGKMVAPELLQKHANPEEISAAVLKVLNDNVYRDWMKTEFAKIKEKFTAGEKTDLGALIVSLLASR